MIYIRITRKEEKIRVNLCRSPSAVNVMLKLSNVKLNLSYCVRAHAHLRAVITRKSCAVRMRNAMLRNHLGVHV